MSDASTGDAKRVVLDFFDLTFVQRHPEQARDRYLGTTYTQHTHRARRGSDLPGPHSWPLRPGTRGILTPQTRDLRRRHGRLHYNLTVSPDDLGQAEVDFSRVDKGRIIEH